MAGAVEAAAADRATVRGMYRCAASPVAAESGRVPSPYLTVWVASRTQPLGDQELSRPLKDPSLPELEFEAHAAGAGRLNLVILDRDGVINEALPGHVRSADDWRPIPGSLDAIARLGRAGYRVVVATRQPGHSAGVTSPSKTSTESMN